MDGAIVEATNRAAGGFGGLAGGRAAPDLSPDLFFESKGRLTDYGYEIEVRLPFKACESHRSGQAGEQASSDLPRARSSACHPPDRRQPESTPKKRGLSRG